MTRKPNDLSWFGFANERRRIYIRFSDTKLNIESKKTNVKYSLEIQYIHNVLHKLGQIPIRMKFENINKQNLMLITFIYVN